MALDNELFPILIFVIFGFLLGGIWFFFSSKGRPLQERKYRFWKYWSYAGIVSISSCFAALGGIFWFVYCLILILVGLWEISSALFKGNKYLLMILLFPYFLISFGFLYSFQIVSPKLVLWLYLGIAGFDAFSQIVGQSFGKRKISYGISPNKTWEGFLGGIVYLLLFSYFSFSLWGRFTTFGIFLAAFLGSLGLVGDLLASWVKRKAHIKDFASYLPGHGGILDRFDSFIFAAGSWTWIVFIGGKISEPWF